MALSALPPTTHGELLFQDYLNAMRYPYELEKEFPGKKKRPDYTVNRNGLFLFDVKDFEPCMAIRSWFSAYDPYPRIREKIDQGRKSLRNSRITPVR